MAQPAKKLTDAQLRAWLNHRPVDRRNEYPAITLDAARSTASTYLDQARRGISPVKALEAAATAGGLTVAPGSL